MKVKQILSAIISFGISILYLGAAGDTISIISKATRANFGILWLIPYAVSAVLYFIMGFLLFTKKYTKKNAIKLFIET